MKRKKISLLLILAIALTATLTVVVMRLAHPSPKDTPPPAEDEIVIDIDAAQVEYIKIVSGDGADLLLRKRDHEPQINALINRINGRYLFLGECPASNTSGGGGYSIYFLDKSMYAIDKVGFDVDFRLLVLASPETRLFYCYDHAEHSVDLEKIVRLPVRHP